MNDISQLIRPELVLINPQLDTSTAAIKALGSLLVEDGFGKSTLVDAALERERLHPTGLALDSGGINAAIPHADREHVAAPAIAVAVLATPINFRQMDDPDAEIPVRLVFLLALSDPESQVQTLRALGKALQNQELISRLVASTTPEELISVISDKAGSA